MNNCWTPRDSNRQSSFCAYFVSTEITGTETSVGEMHIMNRQHKLDTTSMRKMDARWPTVGPADPTGQPSPGGAHSAPSTSICSVRASKLPFTPACSKIQLINSCLIKNCQNPYASKNKTCILFIPCFLWILWNKNSFRDPMLSK